MRNLPAIAANLPGLYIAALIGITLILWSLIYVAIICYQRPFDRRKEHLWTAGVVGFLSYFPLSIVLARFGVL